ncbi:MAG: AtpZ/AtpI family protein [Propionibacteriaceae bacterium]|jgi:F0F1-type ATP synthase assembly protein I
MTEHHDTDQGMRIISYLVSGLVLYGGIGWALDWWFKTSFWLPTGLLVGVALGMYLVIKRFGRP